MKPERRITLLDATDLRMEPGDHETRITGRAAVFRSRSVNLGGFFEEIEPGFFSNVTSGDTRLLLNHEASFLLGRTASGTLQLKETGSALEIDARLSNTARNRDFVINPMERGDMSGMSFAFNIGKGGDRWEDIGGGMMLRTLLPGGCAELPDVSFVTFPAYPATDAALRSLEHWQAAHRGRRKALEIRARAAALGGI